MGFFDSSSSSSTSYQTNNIKKDAVTGNDSQSVYADAGANVNVSDRGAINGALNFAGASNAGAFDLVRANDAATGKNYERLLSTTSTALTGILNGTAATQNFIASTQAAAKGTLDSRTIMVLGLAVAAVLGFGLMRGRE